MRVHLRAFASLREYLPKGTYSKPGEAELELSDEATLKDLFIALGLERQLGVKIFDSQVDHIFQVMINHVAVNAYDHPLAEGDEIALFPPMAGG
jgi:molybdopterin converting factor small subunit